MSWVCSAFVEMNELRTPKKIYIREEIVQLDPKGLKKKKTEEKTCQMEIEMWSTVWII